LRSFAYFVLIRLVGVFTRGGSVSELQLENAVLRHQLKILRRTVHRPEVKDRDRTFLAAASRALCRERWTSFMVRPQTLLRWHRELVRRTSTRAVPQLGTVLERHDEVAFERQVLRCSRPRELDLGSLMMPPGSAGA
jgi:hypothetical protein